MGCIKRAFPLSLVKDHTQSNKKIIQHSAALQRIDPHSSLPITPLIFSCKLSHLIDYQS